MKEAHLIVVGKLKDKNLESIENDYLKRLRLPNLQVHEVKAKAQDQQFEVKEIQKKISEISKSPFIIALAEKGLEFNSVDFSNWIFETAATQGKPLIFVIAGAEGHTSEFLALANAKLSLSKLTFPHKIARIIFIEQFYRAITIKENHPYHN